MRLGQVNLEIVHGNSEIGYWVVQTGRPFLLTTYWGLMRSFAGDKEGLGLYKVKDPTSVKQSPSRQRGRRNHHQQAVTTPSKNQ